MPTEAIRRDEAWSAARRANPPVRLTLRADEVRRLVTAYRSEAESDENSADDYALTPGYEMTVEDLRVAARRMRDRADALEARESDVVGAVYRRLLGEASDAD